MGTFPLRLSKPKALITSGKFCLPAPVAMRGVFSTVPNTVAITSITQAAGVATVTTSVAHNLPVGYSRPIIISGATGATAINYNGQKMITVTGTTTFTYSIASATASPAAGTLVLILPECIATGTGTFATYDLQVGSCIYVPALNQIREVSRIDTDTRWAFSENFTSAGVVTNVSGAAVLVAPSTLYKGVAVYNAGAANGVYKEVAITPTDMAENNFDEAGLGPVCGDATGTTFKINIQ